MIIVIIMRMGNKIMIFIEKIKELEITWIKE